MRPNTPAPAGTSIFWPAYLGNAARTPFLRERLSEAPPSVVWSAPVSPGLRGPPIVTDDVIVAAGTDRHIYVMSRQDGSLLWRKKLDGPPVPPVIKGDVIYTATENDGKLRSLSLRQGEEIWKQDFPSVSTPIALAGDTLYAATEDGFLYAVTQYADWVWRVSFPHAASAGPLILRDWAVYVTIDSLYLLDRTDGHRLSAAESPEIIAGEVSSDGERLYSTTETGSLIAWSLPDLDPLWKASGFGTFVSGPVIADGVGYAVTRSGQVLRFSAHDGSAQIIADIGGTVTAAPTAVENGVLVGTLEGRLHFVARNGGQLWEVELDGSIEAPVAVREGRIVVPMFGPTSGALGSKRLRGKIMELE